MDLRRASCLKSGDHVLCSGAKDFLQLQIKAFYLYFGHFSTNIEGRFGEIQEPDRDVVFSYTFIFLSTFIP